MKDLLKKIVFAILPIKFHLTLIYYYLQRNNKLDPEMLYVSQILKNKRRFLDIGANIGIYSYHFRNIFKNVDSFEPLTNTTARLRALRHSSITIHDVALSNEAKKSKFYIPFYKNKITPALASFNKNEYNEEIDVDVKTIDSYSFTDVDLIKIDVEGHEEFVISGAYQTIKKSRPILIIEIEQRHINKDISEVFKSILRMEYKGFFLLGKNKKLISLDKFHYQKHQKLFIKDVMSNQYINNFIFVPKTEL